MQSKGWDCLTVLSSNVPAHFYTPEVNTCDEFDSVVRADDKDQDFWNNRETPNMGLFSINAGRKKVGLPATFVKL